MAALAFFTGFYALFVPAPGPALEAGRLGAGLGAFGLASLASRPLAGMAVDRRGGRAVLATGGALLAACGLASWAAPGAWAAAAVRALLGLAYAAFSSALGPLAASLAGRDRCPEAVARSGIPANLAMGLAPAAALFMRSRIDSRAPAAAAVAFGVTSTLLAWSLAGSGDPSPPQRSDDSCGGLRAEGLGEAPATADPPAGRPGAAELAAMTALAGLAFAAFTHLAPLSLGPRVPAALAAYAAGMVVGRSFGIDLARRLKLGLATSYALTGAGLAALGAAPPVAAALVAPALLAAGLSYQHPALLSLHLLRRPPARQGGGAAGFYLAHDLGIALGALPFALAPSANGAGAALGTGAGVAGIGLILARRATRRRPAAARSARAAR
jgi:predicted MFS family arabinose efflux permease